MSTSRRMNKRQKVAKDGDLRQEFFSSSSLSEDESSLSSFSSCSSEHENEPTQNILLLAMVWKEFNILEKEAKKRKRDGCRSRDTGQEFRDYIRITELNKTKPPGLYNIHTLDDKHTSETSFERRHFQGSFGDLRRLRKQYPLFKSTKYSKIMMDYCFSPTGTWCSERWNGFFREIANGKFNDSLEERGEIWIPNTRTELPLDEIQEHFVVDLIRNPMENIMYAATRKLIESYDDTDNKDQQFTRDYIGEGSWNQVLSSENFICQDKNKRPEDDVWFFKLTKITK